MEIIGKEIEFGVATESARGVSETVADKWTRKVDANIVEKAVHTIDETTRAKLEAGEGRRVVQKYVEGELTGIAHADVLGWFFSNLYGLVVSSNVAGSVYSHVFNLKQNIQHQSLTLFAKDGAVQQLIYGNAMISSLELTVALEDYIRFTASFTGSSAVDNSDTPAYDTEYDFIAKDVEVKLADSEAELVGASATKVKDLSIKFDQGTIRDHVVGSYNPDDIYNSQMMVDGSFTLNFTDEIFKDLYLNDSSKYMQITITGDSDIGGGNYPTITILLNKVQFMEWNRSGSASDLVTEPISFRAFFNETDGKQSQVTLKNLTASYTNVPSS